MMGYKMILIMPENSSAERVQAMRAYGAEVILTPKEASMPGSIDLARNMEAAGQGPHPRSILQSGQSAGPL